MTNTKQLLGTILVLTSGLLYGMIGYFGMMLFAQGYSVPSMLFWRFAIATLWMLAACAILRRKRKINFTKAKAILMLKLTTVGSISYAGGSAFFYLASLYIGTGPGMVIFFSFPVFVVLFSLYFGRARLNPFMIISLLMVITGLILLNGAGHHNLSNTGILLAMIAAFSYGVYVYYSQDSAKHADSLWLTCSSAQAALSSSLCSHYSRARLSCLLRCKPGAIFLSSASLRPPSYSTITEWVKVY